MSKYDSYNPDWVANFYDEYGDREWTRFTRSPADEVSLFLHTHYLERFVEPGSRVLEVGAGPGRFTKSHGRDELPGLGGRHIPSAT